MEQIKSKWPIEGWLESRIGGRAENQDYLTYGDTPHGLLVLVCDGMGGGPAGRVASENAAETILAEIAATETDNSSNCALLEQAILKADQKLKEMQEGDKRLRGMGTTVTAFLYDEKSVCIAHVGDSRIYQFRFGNKHFRTFDHSQVMEQVAEGKMTEEEARNAPNSNVITRALGVMNSVKVETHELPYEQGDRFVLCTDGAWGSMPEKDFIQLLTKPSQISGALEQAMIKVDEIGREAGCHHDNLSIAIIETKQNSKLQEKMTHKTRRLLQILAICLGISLLANIALLCWNLFSGNGTATLANTDEYASLDEMRESIIALQNQNKNMEAAINDLRQKNDDDMKAMEQTLRSNNPDSVAATMKKFIEDDKVEIDRQNELTEQIDKLIKEMEILQQSTKDKIEQVQVDSLRKSCEELMEQLRNEKPGLAYSLKEDVIDKLSGPICTQANHNGRSRRFHYTILIDQLKKIKYDIITK